MSVNKNPYFTTAIKNIPRLLTLIDRNPDSQTYGCFDRKYWKYKITDYVNARFQEACLSLALLYTVKSKDNPYYKDKEIKKLSVASMIFWAKMQEKDGSFNEYYPKEKSHVATAFSAFCVAKSYILLNIKNQTIENALEKACGWLNKNDDLCVVNHDAGTLPVMYMTYIITGKEKYRESCKEKLDKIQRLQSKEGWFQEYDGADIGYTSFSLYYLNEYYKLTKDKKVFLMMKKAMDFLIYFCHPDGTMGGHYGSRETHLILPTPFEELKESIQSANLIANHIKKNIRNNILTNPNCFDDRFTADCLYPYLQLNSIRHKGTTAKLPKDGKDFQKHFKSAGLYIRKYNSYYFISNIRKCSAFTLFKNKNLLMKDTGYLIKSNRNKYISDITTDFVITKEEITIKGKFRRFREQLQTPFTTMIVRLASSVGLGAFLKRIIRQVLIRHKPKGRFRIIRKIRFENKNIDIKDKIICKKNMKIKHTQDYSKIYSTSTSLYQNQKKQRSSLGHTGKNEFRMKNMISR